MAAGSLTRPSSDAVRLTPIVSEHYNNDVNTLYEGHNELFSEFDATRSDYETRMPALEARVTDLDEATTGRMAVAEADIDALQAATILSGVEASASPHTVDLTSGRCVNVTTSTLDPVVRLPDPADLAGGEMVFISSKASSRTLTVEAVNDGGGSSILYKYLAGTGVIAMCMVASGARVWKMFSENGARVRHPMDITANTNYDMDAGDVLNSRQFCMTSSTYGTTYTLRLPPLASVGVVDVYIIMRSSNTSYIDVRAHADDGSDLIIHNSSALDAIHVFSDPVGGTWHIA